MYDTEPLQLLVPSVRNSAWMNVSLLEQTQCTKFLYGPELADRVFELKGRKKDLQVYAVQSLSDLLQEYDKHYPYDFEFSKVRWDPVLILHSSGSTGRNSIKMSKAEKLTKPT